MRSSPMSPSRSRSSTDLPAAPLALVLGVSLASASLLAGCGDDDCGPGDAPNSGLTAASADGTLSYRDLTWLLGNDCPAPDAPEGVVSMSIEGTQTNGTGRFTVCIPRPDLLDASPRTLGTITSSADVRIVDLGGDHDGCTYAFDASRPPSGTVVALGVCGQGLDPAGFALDFDGAVSLRRTCNGTEDTVAVTLTGRIAVAKRAR